MKNTIATTEDLINPICELFNINSEKLESLTIELKAGDVVYVNAKYFVPFDVKEKLEALVK